MSEHPTEITAGTPPYIRRSRAIEIGIWALPIALVLTALILAILGTGAEEIMATLWALIILLGVCAMGSLMLYAIRAVGAEMAALSRRQSRVLRSMGATIRAVEDERRAR